MSLPRADDWTDPGTMDPPPRWGRRVGIVTALLAIALVGSLLVWREANFRRIPDAREPFDTRAAGSIDLPDELNAFTYYRQAVGAFRDDPRFGRAYVSWAKIPPAEREWLKANAGAMELWYFATTMDRAVFVQPRDYRFDTGRDVIAALPRLARIGQLAGLGMEAQGNFDEAWSWYRAALRSSRHCGRHAGFAERLVGARILKMMEPSVLAWIDQPNLSPADLRRALDDLKSIDEMTSTFAENLQAEYFATLASLDTPTRGLDARSPFQKLRSGFEKFALREPARSRRVQRLIWTDWLAAARLPIEERARREQTLAHGYFYDVPDDAVPFLLPDTLDRWVGTTVDLNDVLPDVAAFDQALRAEAALRASLLIDVAEALYARENGRRPDSPEQLVGPYLKSLPEGYDQPHPAAK